MLSQKAFDEFKALYQKNYKEVPNDEVLFTIACNWLEGMNIVYRPIKKEWLEEYEREKAKLKLKTDLWKEKRLV